MSEKTLKLRAKQRSNGRGWNSKHGSFFPRHKLNKFEGRRLGHRKAYCLYQDNYSWRGDYLDSTVVEGFLGKWINKPYSDCCRAWQRKTKDLQAKRWHATHMTSWIDEYLNEDRWVGRKGSWYVDDKGLLQKSDKDDSTCISPLTKQQLRHNKKIEISINKWDSVAIPWGSYYYRDHAEYLLDIKYKQPRLIGEMYCVIDKEVLLLPVYHVYEGYFYRSHGEGYYAKHMINTPNYLKYKFIEDNWIIPKIKTRKSYYYNELYHSKLKSVLSRKYQDQVEAIKKVEEDIRRTEFEDPYNMHERYKETLLRYQKELTQISKYERMETGYGKLCPLVKRKDYEEIKALSKLSNI